MKNKRNLATSIMALMLISFMCAISASAISFTDNSRISTKYFEAVIYMTEKSILTGYPDGSFQPQGTLTREQAAKIVTYLVLGPEEAEQLVCNEAPYVDVETWRWSAPYIAWCNEFGILNGYGDGRFGPTDNLTGEQFAKMLLCSFNGDAKGRYTGPGWAERVKEDGVRFSLFYGDSTMCSNEPLQRQQAALMAMNAEKKPDEEFVHGESEIPTEQHTESIDVCQQNESDSVFSDVEFQIDSIEEGSGDMDDEDSSIPYQLNPNEGEEDEDF